MSSIASRLFRRGPKAQIPPAAEEKSAAVGGWDLPITGGFLPHNVGRFWNWWQMGHNPLGGGRNSTVHACVDAYAQTIASMNLQHLLRNDDVGTEVIETSALSRIARNPNSYQTRSDFMNNVVKSLLLEGNSYALARRNARYEVESLHLIHPRNTQVYVGEDQSVFYGLGDNAMLGHDQLNAMVPARDVWHLRLYTPRHPLVGVSPIENLGTSLATNNAIGMHNATFFTNMRRPAGVLSTTERLNRDQIGQLREAWDAQSQDLNSGGVPILAGGLTWHPMSITSTDAQTIEAYRVSIEDIATAFRVPLPIIGDTRNASYSNVEELASMWLALGLGFLVEHIELSLNKFFAVQQGTYATFDTDSLLRTDFAGRMDAFVKAVQGGIYSPNEARRKEGLKSVPYGDEPRLQAQNVPLSAAGQIPATPTTPATPAAPANPSDDSGDNDGDNDDDGAEEAAAMATSLKRIMAS